MRISLVLRAVATSWVAVIANAAVGFLLTPYVLHRLGDEAFGVWVLITNLVGYYGLVDAGVRSAILRYVSRHKELKDQKSVNEVVATAFYYYLGACMLVILATHFSVDAVSRFFSIDSTVHSAFKSLFLLAGLVQGLILAIIYVLRAGGGLFAVGATTILSQLLAYTIQVPLAIRAQRGLTLHPKWIRKTVLWDMLRYGSISVGVGIAEKMKVYIYPVVIARFLTPVAVTFFALPMKILAFPAEGIGSMTEIINPLSSQLDARNDFAKLRELIQMSVQSAFLILAPLAAFLFVFGRELLALWVGPQYSSAYPLLVLLTMGIGTAATQCCVQSMLFGIEKHKQLVWYRLGEGLSITVLGSAALRIAGLEGFALVIAVTLLFTSLVLVPRHLCRILNLPLRRYLLQGCVKPCVLAFPMAATLVALRYFLMVNAWPAVLLAALVGCLFYALSLLFVSLFYSYRLFHLLKPDVLQVLEQKIWSPPHSKFRSVVNALRSEASQTD